MNKNTNIRISAIILRTVSVVFLLTILLTINTVRAKALPPIPPEIPETINISVDDPIFLDNTSTNVTNNSTEYNSTTPNNTTINNTSTVNSTNNTTINNTVQTNDTNNTTQNTTINNTSTQNNTTVNSTGYNSTNNTTINTTNTASTNSNTGSTSTSGSGSTKSEKEDSALRTFFQRLMFNNANSSKNISNTTSSEKNIEPEIQTPTQIEESESQNTNTDTLYGGQQNIESGTNTGQAITQNNAEIKTGIFEKIGISKLTGIGASVVVVLTIIILITIIITSRKKSNNITEKQILDNTGTNRNVLYQHQQNNTTYDSRYPTGANTSTQIGQAQNGRRIFGYNFSQQKETYRQKYLQWKMRHNKQENNINRAGLNMNSEMYTENKNTNQNSELKKSEL